jgi:hypothetical protein
LQGISTQGLPNRTIEEILTLGGRIENPKTSRRTYNGIALCGSEPWWQKSLLVGRKL